MRPTLVADLTSAGYNSEARYFHERDRELIERLRERNQSALNRRANFKLIEGGKVSSRSDPSPGDSSQKGDVSKLAA
jgi:hypothetical protein